jgi:hypothetical protein
MTREERTIIWTLVAAFAALLAATEIALVPRHGPFQLLILIGAGAVFVYTLYKLRRRRRRGSLSRAGAGQGLLRAQALCRQAGSGIFQPKPWRENLKHMSPA